MQRTDRKKLHLDIMGKKLEHQLHQYLAKVMSVPGCPIPQAYLAQCTKFAMVLLTHRMQSRVAQAISAVHNQESANEVLRADINLIRESLDEIFVFIAEFEEPELEITGSNDDAATPLEQAIQKATRPGPDGIH